MNLDFQTLLLSHIVAPPTTTVTIPVSVNTNHPSQVVEEEVVDNETIDNETILVETQIISWSDNFTRDS